MLLYGEPPSCDVLLGALGTFNAVVGSLHIDEESALIRAVVDIGGRTLVAPRYLAQASRLYRRLKSVGVDVALRTDANARTAQVVILNTIGELHAAYGLAPVAIVGGTFGRRGGQNLLEPVTMGCPVIHGPKCSRVFDEVQALKEYGGIRVESLADAFRLVQAADYPRVDLVGIRTFFPFCIDDILRRLRAFI